MKRIFSMLIALSLLCCIPLTAYAHDVPQERNDCTIELIVRYDGEDISGGTLTAVKVGYVAEDDGNYYFSRVFDNIRLDDVQTADAVAELQEFYDANLSDYDFYKQTISVSNGKAAFTDLPTGLYLIIQEQAANGYSKLNAFLISVPFLEDGKYQYNVNVTIKPELEREPDPTKPTAPSPTDPTLPQTGQLNWPVPVLVASGLVVFVLGWFLRFGRKKEDNEK